MMPQLTDAVRSLRGLTDLLQRQPEALIRGRTDKGTERDCFGFLTPTSLVLACLVALGPALRQILSLHNRREGWTDRQRRAEDIELRDIGLAGYLDRSHVVLGSDDFRLQVMANDCWGEPLGEHDRPRAGSRTCARLPGSNVYSERSSISLTADAVVEVNVQQMDVGNDGNLTLLAQVAVKFMPQATTGGAHVHHYQAARRHCARQ